MTEQDHTAAIAALNDACRAEPGVGWVMTQGVWALSEADQRSAFAAVTAFTDFHEDNNPHGERDCGAFMVGTAKLFWNRLLRPRP